jgi:hypothetical protein
LARVSLPAGLGIQSASNGLGNFHPDRFPPAGSMQMNCTNKKIKFTGNARSSPSTGPSPAARTMQLENGMSAIGARTLGRRKSAGTGPVRTLFGWPYFCGINAAFRAYWRAPVSCAVRNELNRSGAGRGVPIQRSLQDAFGECHASCSKNEKKCDGARHLRRRNV